MPACKSTCKLTDFGVSRLPGGGVLLGGSRPWQAPECSRGAFFKIEEAKSTDIYSFGMLLWRVVLDGDPFKLLGDFEGPTSRERRDRRNEAIARLKEEDQLVQHVCHSLALSEHFTHTQLEMLCEVISITLIKDSSQRELDITRLIRLLSKDQWYEARHPVSPARIPVDIDASFLDLEKWWHEFSRISPVVHCLIAAGLLESIHGSPDEEEKELEEHRVSASYQLALCYANGTGVPFSPESCLQWLAFAANNGSEKAYHAHQKIAEGLEVRPVAFVNPWNQSSTAANPDSPFESISHDEAGSDSSATAQQAAGRNSLEDRGLDNAETTFLGAAQSCQYEALTRLLASDTKPTVSEDGVSPLHFASSWDTSQACTLVPALIKAGVDVDALAQRGPTVGGTPLMWSVHGDHIEHSQLLLAHGANPLVALEDGENALIFAASHHCSSHLRLLLTHSQPTLVKDQFQNILVAALGGVSRFKRLFRHGIRWKIAAEETLKLLRDWDLLYNGADHYERALLRSLSSNARNAYARMNTDVQMASIHASRIDHSLLGDLLRESVLNYDKGLFDALLDYDVPTDGTFKHHKTLLHLCAKIPDHSVAASDFAPSLLKRGGDIHARDSHGITPWMDAILERKWDLADMYMKAGADPLATDNDGFNVMGLCIRAVNVGSIKYLLKYCAKASAFQEHSFLVNEKAQISALQLAASLPLPRAHGMKLEVLGVFHNIFATFGLQSWQRRFRSNGLLPTLVPNATALDIAAALGNVYAVKNLVKKGAHEDGDGPQAVRHARAALDRSRAPQDSMERKNLNRCIFIIEEWDQDAQGVRKKAEDWTNMRTMDESHVPMSWEMVVFDYKSRKGIQTEE